MKYTKATNYALHIMAYFVKQEGKDNLSLQPLASHMNISPTYLSKILTQLVKADLIQSTPGVNGGYTLRKSKTEISFYDVIQAIEGSGALFTCEMDEKRACHIEKVMRDAEEKMVNHLKEKRIYDMHHHNQLDQNFLNKIAFLDSRQRERLIPPEALISQMPIQKNHTLFDVGAGSGFFTIPMAENTSSKVYAMDSDRRMLSVIENKAKEKGLTNIELIQDYIENLSIQYNSIDFVMASLILHEVSSLTTALSNIFKVLKSGGHLLCLEYEKDDLIIEGPPMSIRIGSEELEKALSSIGFDIVKKTQINDAIYTVLAVKRRPKQVG